MLPPRILSSSMESIASHLGACSWITAAISAGGPELAPVDVTMRLPAADAGLPGPNAEAAGPIDYEALGNLFCRELVEERKRRIVLEGYHDNPSSSFVTVEKQDDPCPILRAYHRSSSAKLCGMAFYRLPGEPPFHRDESRRLREILEDFSGVHETSQNSAPNVLPTSGQN